ncbi:PAS domain-containing sensor histidine kinase [Candidatus Trichorickettsia mobilis]|uniref:PAS domain-containing sensor histidine kinase n=1 Tax=Candidatus Trichorickettsia mobilis TaxID=1346319 RepID=UPI00292FF9EA|nr:ATP-binding protein [Candidatus Trichorickettsia mobilis]
MKYKILSHVESFSLLLATLESTADGILVVDNTGKILGYNKRFIDLWHIPPEIEQQENDEPALNYVLSQLVDPVSFVEKVKELYQDLTQESFDTLLFKDGRIFERYSIPQQIEGKIVGRVWSFRDVTEKVKAIRQLEQYKENLEHLVNERTQELVTALDTLKQNQLQLIQSEKMASLGQLITGIAHEVNTPLGAIIAGIGEIEKYCSSSTQVDVEFLNLAESQKTIYRDLCTQILSFNYVGQSTKERRSAAKLISEKLVANGLDLSSTLSKDLASMGFTDQNMDGVLSLLKNPNGNYVIELLKQFGINYLHIKNIKVAGSRISSLVTALRSYSRADAGTITETDICSDIDTTITILHNKLKYGINVITNYQPLPKFLCRAEQLIQVWTNILNNAIYSMKGNGQIIITTSLQENNIIVEFEDDGPGISPELISRIFEPYFTTKPRGEGIGIGLTICQKIIKTHNGQITFTSRPGSTCFKIILPVIASVTT